MDMKNQLHPGAKWLFRFRAYLGAIFLLIFLSWFIIPIIFVVFKSAFEMSNAANLAGIIGVVTVYIILVIIIGEIYSRMAYNRWFYEFTSDNLKVEKGIIWKRYSNVPYERVQNVDIQRGIIARIMGFSSVMIQTAGYSYTGRGAMPGSEGYLPAVSIDAAEKIREFLIKKISRKGSKSGL